MPPAILHLLHLEVGSPVGLTIDGGRLLVEPYPRVLDLNSRNARKLESVSAAIMEEVLAKLIPAFE